MQKGSLRCCLLLLFYTGQGSIKKSFVYFLKDGIFCCNDIFFFIPDNERNNRLMNIQSWFAFKWNHTNPFLQHNTAHSKVINFLKISYCIINSFFLWKIGETVTRLNLKSIYKDIMHYPSSIRRSSSSFVSSYPYYVTLFA